MLRSRPIRSILLASAAATGAVLVAAAPATAHPGHGSSGLGEGLLHPVTGPDHLLAMVAVGVVAALASRRGTTWKVPGAFLAGMVVAGVAGIAGLAIPGVELLIVASVVLLGLTIVGAVETGGRRFGLLLGALALAGAVHGNAHGLEVPASAHPAAYVAGFVAATAVLHALGVGVGTVIRDHRTMRMGVGAAAVAAGVLLLV